jgi:hypothetical protein
MTVVRFFKKKLTTLINADEFRFRFSKNEVASVYDETFTNLQAVKWIKYHK